jgi:hypothetical protein
VIEDDAEGSMDEPTFCGRSPWVRRFGEEGLQDLGSASVTRRPSARDQVFESSDNAAASD